MTTLHITRNSGSGSEILCGAERNQTYGSIAEGTADRYVDRYFAEKQLFDPELCRDCLEVHDRLPAPQPPSIFNLGK